MKSKSNQSGSKRRTSLITAFLFILCLGCQKNDDPNEIISDAVYQISTLDALLAGDYDGRMTFSNLLEFGDFGVGTLEAVDGELLILEGIAYQMTIDKMVNIVPETAETPFAVVKYFQTDSEMPLGKIDDFVDLQNQLDQHIDRNKIVAIRIDALFDSLTIRSVQRQNEPYPPLSEVVANQVVFNQSNISGTLVGFYFPAFADGINVAGYHFHFISDDRNLGGHLLQCKINTGNVFFDLTDDLQVSLGQK